MFALELAAKAVVPELNNVVKAVNMAKNAAIKRLNYCFIFCVIQIPPSFLGMKKAGLTKRPAYS